MKLPDQLRLPHAEHPSPLEFAEALVATSKSGEDLPVKGSERNAELAVLSKALISIANQTWRLMVATHDSESKQPKAELSEQDKRRIVAAIEATREAAEAVGIRIVDRVREPFNPGLPEQVVTEEPTVGISEERIIRTIRPTIMWNQTMVQRGEIDIAVPLRTTEP